MILYYDLWDNFNYAKIVEDIVNYNPDQIVILGENEWDIWFDTAFLQIVKQCGIKVKFVSSAVITDHHYNIIKNSGIDVELESWPTYYFKYCTSCNAFPNYNSYKIGPDFKYKFICLNNRGHTHRCHVIDHIAKQDLLDKGVISWIDFLNESDKYNFKYFDRRKMKLDDNFDKLLDSYIIPDEYTQSFFHFITEATHESIIISEKTIITMMFKKPFIVMGAPHFHKYLTELGFELYDELIDYSFDSVEDLDKRAELFVDNMKRISDLTDIPAALELIKPKLERNYKKFLEIMKDWDDVPPEIQKIMNNSHNTEISDLEKHESKYRTLQQYTESYPRMKKVAMIGCGKLGQDCAEVMAEHYDVVGYDIEPRTPSNFKMVSSIEEACRQSDIIFIAAPTPHEAIYGGETPISQLPNKDFDYTVVSDILKEVNTCVHGGQMVVLISTVLPGTVRNQLSQYITNTRFVYNPYLIAMGTIKWDMVNPEMIIIGTEDGSLTGAADELVNFYKVFMENDPRYEIGTWDEAESIKIFYNTFISAKLSLVNMIQDVAETNGNINVDVVTSALTKSTYRIMGPGYMKAGMGDGGACHPRDNIALRFLAERLDLGYDLFDSIMTARERQAERMAKKCLTYGNTICIVGKAYKPAVPYTIGSYSLLVGHYVEQHGGTVTYYDPNTGDHTFADSSVYLIGYWEQWVTDITSWPTGCTVVDPWRIMPALENINVVHYGNTRPR